MALMVSISDWSRVLLFGSNFPLASHHGRGPDLSSLVASEVVRSIASWTVHTARESDAVGDEVRDGVKVIPVFDKNITDLECNLTREANGIDVEDI